MCCLYLMSSCTTMEQVKRKTTGAEVNELLKAASEEGSLKDIMGFETRPLVSTDYTNDERSSIIDARSTMVIDDTCVKVRFFFHVQICFSNSTLASPAARGLVRPRATKLHDFIPIRVCFACVGLLSLFYWVCARVSQHQFSPHE